MLETFTELYTDSEITEDAKELNKFLSKLSLEDLQDLMPVVDTAEQERRVRQEYRKKTTNTLNGIIRSEANLTKYMREMLEAFKGASDGQLNDFKIKIGGLMRTHKSVSSLPKLQTIINKLLKGATLPDDLDKGIDTIKKEMAEAKGTTENAKGTTEEAKGTTENAIDAEALNKIQDALIQIKKMDDKELQSHLVKLSNIQIVALKTSLEVFINN